VRSQGKDFESSSPQRSGFNRAKQMKLTDTVLIEDVSPEEFQTIKELECFSKEHVKSLHYGEEKR